MTVFYILGGLFLALFIIIPLIERSNIKMSKESITKLSRWLWPLMGAILVAQLVMFAFN